MDRTILTGLKKPSSGESLVRTTFSNNMDAIDQNMLVLALCAAAYGELNKGPLARNSIGKPESQEFSSPLGLRGNITWSFTSTAITETLSVTAPFSMTLTKTINIPDFSERWVVS